MCSLGAKPHKLTVFINFQLKHCQEAETQPEISYYDATLPTQKSLDSYLQQ